MAVFVAAADESSSGNRDGAFIYGGLVAPEIDWREWFAPAWEARVLNLSPPIPYLHMVDIRSPKWRFQHGLRVIDAERRLDEACRVVGGMGSLFLVTSRIDEDVFRKSRIIIREPKKAAFFLEPDLLCFFYFAHVVLKYVHQEFPEIEKVDFVVERNGKITSHIKEFYSLMGEVYKETPDAALSDLLGDLIPGGKDRVPLQAADVVCWHDRRFEAGNLSSEDKRRYGILAKKNGYRHEWTHEKLNRFFSGLVLEARFQHPVHEVELSPPVEAVGELVEVEGKVLGRDLVVHAHDAALEQGPHVFDAVGVDLAVHVGLLMVHGLMGEAGGIKPEVGGEFIGMNLSADLNPALDERPESGR